MARPPCWKVSSMFFVMAERFFMVQIEQVEQIYFVITISYLCYLWKTMCVFRGEK